MEAHDSEDARKEALLAALRKTAGSLSAEDYPEWATPGKIAAWVRGLRQVNVYQTLVAVRDSGGDRCE